MVDANTLEKVVDVVKIFGIFLGISVIPTLPVMGTVITLVTYLGSYRPALRKYNEEVNGKQLELFPETIERPNFWRMYWYEIKTGGKTPNRNSYKTY